MNFQIFILQPYCAYWIFDITIIQLKSFVVITINSSLFTMWSSSGKFRPAGFCPQRHSVSQSNFTWKAVSSSSRYNRQASSSLKMPIVCRCFPRFQWTVVRPITCLIYHLLRDSFYPVKALRVTSVGFSSTKLPVDSILAKASAFSLPSRPLVPHPNDRYTFLWSIVEQALDAIPD